MNKLERGTQTYYKKCLLPIMSAKKGNALIIAANKAIDNAYTLTSTNSTPFNLVYKQYKVLQSFWYRVIEDASDSGNSKLEDLCVDLENAVIKCQDWIKLNSPVTKAENEQNPEGQEDKPAAEE